MPDETGNSAQESIQESTGKSEFQVGLAMSGAISAGAYTAGVFDFLIQAFDEWERARANGSAGVERGSVPSHFVGIKVMSGASAGAITAAIGAIALADGDQRPEFFDAAKQRVKCYLPKLYDSWVVRPTLVADSKGADDFLTPTDIAGPNLVGSDNFSRTSPIPKPELSDSRPVTSLLNARLLDGIAKAALDVKTVGKLRAYLSKTLHIYLTLTNFRGVPYQISFEGGDYHMMSHGDRVHYAVAGLGDWDTESEFSDSDRGRDIDTKSLVSPYPEKQIWNDFAVCALASAAFPVGLAPRQIYAALNEYDCKTSDDPKFRRFPSDDLARRSDIKPAWPALTDYTFMTCDGGTIDNDPFEYARFALKKKGQLEDPIERDLEHSDRAVIMISPFPEAKPILAADEPGWDIVSIISALLPSLIDQARFKPSELVLAADPTVGSRYLIFPKRYGTDGKTLEPYGIASGLLGGFGGFVSRAFRDHDFQLGRRNCQQFLKATFALPATNRKIKNWPPQKQFKALQNDTQMKTNKEEQYCLIPCLGTALDEVKPLDWPRISRSEFETLQARIAKRYEAVAPALIAQTISEKALLIGLRALGSTIRKKVLDFIEAKILADLVRRDQIEGFADLPDIAGLQAFDVRLILAELITPDRSGRSVGDIAKVIGQAKKEALSDAQITNVLEELRTAAGKPYEVWKAPWKDDHGQSLYALADRKPDLLTQAGSTLGAFLQALRAMASREG
jgi:hypothetical protein